MSTPQPWQLVLGFAHTHLLYAFAQTGIFQQLQGQPRTVEEVAAACHLDRAVLHRAFRFAQSLGLIGQESGGYVLAPLGRAFAPDTPGNLHNALLLIGTEPWQKAWNHLADSLRTGKSAFEQVFGQPLFPYLSAHPDVDRLYNQWMTEASTRTAALLPTCYDFSPFRSVCDIGGGQGILLKGILAANPHLHGILCDQPHVANTDLLKDHADRMEIRHHDFFESVPSAEVLILKSVIHDWDDERAVRILQVCRKAMPEGGKMLIVERVLENENDASGFFFDLHMQVLLGSQERTELEFRQLFEKAGLRLERIIATPSPMRIMEIGRT